MRTLRTLLAGFISVIACHVNATVVTLNTDQTDYTFQSGNTYYITNNYFELCAHTSSLSLQ